MHSLDIFNLRSHLASQSPANASGGPCSNPNAVILTRQKKPAMTMIYSDSNVDVCQTKTWLLRSTLVSDFVRFLGQSKCVSSAQPCDETSPCVFWMITDDSEAVFSIWRGEVKRDATTLAKMHRAGDLISVWMPDAQLEAVRDLVRARETSMYQRNKARQALSSFLHAKAIATVEGAPGLWPIGAGWLRSSLSIPPSRLICRSIFITIQEADARHDRLVKQIEAAFPAWTLAPPGHRAPGDARRCSDHRSYDRRGDRRPWSLRHVRRLMAYLGLVPASIPAVRRSGVVASPRPEMPESVGC